MTHHGAPLPTYDRKRLEVLVMEHRMRVHHTRKQTAKTRPQAGVKAPR